LLLFIDNWACFTNSDNKPLPMVSAIIYGTFCFKTCHRRYSDSSQSFI
jgi:hypothetical protein